MNTKELTSLRVYAMACRLKELLQPSSSTCSNMRGPPAFACTLSARAKEALTRILLVEDSPIIIHKGNLPPPVEKILEETKIPRGSYGFEPKHSRHKRKLKYKHHR